MKTHLTYIALIVLAIILSCLLTKCSGNKKLQQQITFTDNLSDTLRTTRNSFGQEKSRTSTLETANTALFLNTKTSDSTVKWLQNVVSNYKKELKNSGSATVFSGITTVNVSGKTTITHDTTWMPYESKYEVPAVYSTVLKNKWYNGTVIARQDSIHLDIAIENSYSVVIGEEGKWWKKKTPFVEVTNLNPYTKTKTLKSYEVSGAKDKKWGIGANIGYGFSKTGLSPYVGIGIQYSLIKF